MPFKRMHRVKKITAGAGGRKRASLGKKVFSFAKKHKKSLAIGGGAFYLGSRRRREDQ